MRSVCCATSDAEDKATFEERRYSERFTCAYDGFTMDELEPRNFSFNSPHGACPACTGLGTRLEIDPDLVIPDRVIDAAGEPHAIAPAHHRVAVAGAGAAVCTGSLVTTREIVATPEAKAALFAASGAVAADMESAVLVARAAAAGCPALVVRAVSDSARQSLPPELTRLVTPEGRLRLARTLAMTVTRPATLQGALELRRRTHQALRAVARVLAALIG